MERDVRNRLTSHHLVIEKLNWYAQRRKIETYHKIFKSERRAERNRLREERNRQMHEVGYAKLALVRALRSLLLLRPIHHARRKPSVRVRRIIRVSQKSVSGHGYSLAARIEARANCRAIERIARIHGTATSVDA
jgi:hypothetical protein